MHEQDHGADGQAEDDSCGATFRDIYATEVVTALYSNLQRCLDGDMANVRIHQFRALALA